ncbi:hemin ABC transporter substrate-binding protein [Dietzia sp. 179-F 9C3 NHS]|uniref:hemin ABC transporter substrate-binding protein n=1 Tax=Dietzia sp. 179-F 9C3 NHS TaxID=3374295 RepID=UPI003879C9F9
MLRRRTGAARIVTSALLVLALGACGASAGSSGSDVITEAPLAADVTPASDTREFQGELILDLADDPIDPVDGPEPALPVTVTDNQGTEVEITDISRILPLDLYGTTSRMVFELGLGENVIGRDVSSNFDEIADRPLVTTNGHELSAEAILDLNPSVLITDTSLGPWDVVLQIRDAGIPVVVVDADRGLDNITSLTMSVAEALGVPERGAKLAERIEAETATSLEGVETIVPTDLNQELRTLFIYARGQAGIYYIFGKNSGADSLIEAAGGYDVSSEIGWSGARPANDEAIISAQPDVLLMMTKGLESVGGIDGLIEQFPALANTPAGQNKRVIAMPDEQILSYGTRTPAVLNALAVALYAPGSL